VTVDLEGYISFQRFLLYGGPKMWATTELSVY